MAKGSILSTISGKLGNSVFYKLTDSANKQTQGVRTYQPSVTNPKTAAQATQRMRIRPAVNFYRGLQSLLDHSWQGVKYGNRSRAKFMSIVLSPTFNGFPYVDKGETRFIPGEFPLSVGQIPMPAALHFPSYPPASEKNNFPVVDSGLSFSDAWDDTWGEYSADILKMNPYLQDGDELTFVSVYYDGQTYLPMHQYLVLDSSSLAIASDVMKAAGIFIADTGVFCPISDYTDNGPVQLLTYPWVCVAAGIIISRHPSKSKQWQRSTTFLQVSDFIKSTWMSDQRLLNARATYERAEAEQTSDWLLNQSENHIPTGGINKPTTYTLSFKRVSIGGSNFPMACLSIDGGEELPILQRIGTSYYAGRLDNGTVAFMRSMVISGDIGDAPFVDAAAAKAADRNHTYILIDD